MMSLFDVVTLATVAWRSSSFCTAGPSFLCLSAQIEEEGRGVCEDCCGLHRRSASVSRVACRKQVGPGLSELLAASPLSCFLHTSLFQKTMCMSSKCLSFSRDLVHADPFTEFNFFLQLLNFGLICLLSPDRNCAQK